MGAATGTNHKKQLSPKAYFQLDVGLWSAKISFLISSVISKVVQFLQSRKVWNIHITPILTESAPAKTIHNSASRPIFAIHKDKLTCKRARKQ